MDALLAVDGLRLSFPGQSAPTLDSVSFALPPGEMLALVGESGSGKSLTALSVLGLAPAGSRIEAGEIVLEGRSLRALPEEQLRALRGGRIGMIFQEPMTALNPLHSIGRQIREAIAQHQRLGRKAIEARVAELLAQVGLPGFAPRLAAYPHQLSGGERQRVMIAMAVANRPALLIADEPTTALDVTLQAQILELLKNLQASLGMAILFITHDLTLVRRYADRVAVMRRGRVVEAGPTAEIFAAPQDGYTRMLLASEPTGRAAPLPADAPILLSAEGVAVRYVTRRSFFGAERAATQALHPTSLTLRRGETLGVVGESGSGKTTLGLALTRLVGSTGRIVFDGREISAEPTRRLRPLRRRMQFVFQDPFSSLNPRLSVGEIVGEGLGVHEPGLSPAARQDRVTAMLEEVGFDPGTRHRYPHEFSGGQRQRINIARAMILQPELIVLDEPTSALDLSLQSQILSLLRDLQARHGTAYLFITHDLRVVRAIAHRLLVMKDGRIVEEGMTEAVFTAPGDEYTKRLIEASLHAGEKRPSGGA